jgi:hypothetical protein
VDAESATSKPFDVNFDSILQRVEANPFRIVPRLIAHGETVVREATPERND